LYAIVAQGAFFITPLIVMCVFLLVAVMLTKNDLVLDINALALFGLVLVVIIAAFFSLSADEAINEIVKYMIFPLSYLFFLNADDVMRTKADESFFYAFILLMVFGLLGIAGISPIPNMVTPIGGRLQSFFQYANTTALAMGIGVFYSTEKARNNKRPIVVIYILVALMFFMALVFTLSRMSFVLFILIYGIYVFRIIFPSISWKIKALLIVGIMVTGGILLHIDSRIVRISIFAPTLVERYISYYDALRMLLRHPLGIGLGNWQFMHLYYQSAPYQVRFIHNFYLHVALNGGFLAMGLILALFVTNFVQAKVHDMHFFVGLFIAISAIFEVHFNFGIIIIYFMFLLVRQAQVTTFVVAKKRTRYTKYTLVLPIILLGILFTSNYYINLGRNIEQSQECHNKAYQAYLRAHRINPLSDRLYFHRALVTATPDAMLSLLYQGHRANPWDKDVLFYLAEVHLHKGNFEAAYKYADQLLTLFRFSTRNQELVRRIIYGFDEPLQTDRVMQLENRIVEIDSEINRLYRHIEPNMAY